MNTMNTCFKLLLSSLLAVPAFAQSNWNVEDTGQPSYDVEFQVDEGTWMSVTVSPDGKTLVFDLLGDIYSLPAAGGEAKLLFGGAAMQRNPRFSPDGSQLLYISDGGGSDNFWIANADGSNARQVTKETVRLLSTPAWTGDGKSVAGALQFATEDKHHGAELRIYDLRGGSGRLLVPGPANDEPVNEPQFSRDGRYVYYTEKVTKPSKSRVYVDANHSNLAVMRRDLASGEAQQLIRGFGSAIAPQLSPDDKRIAFVRRVREKTVLFVYDIASGKELPVYEGLDRDEQADYSWIDGYYPQYGWFPDNRHVAIWGKGKLMNVDMDTGQAQEIPFSVRSRHKMTVPPRFTQDLAPKSIKVKAIRQLAYSPDDRVVVFNALGRLWRKQDDAKPTRLTRAGTFEFEPAFSHDGRKVAYVDWNDESGSRLMVVGSQGGAPKTIYSTAGVLRTPSFSPDGSRIVFKIDEGDRCLGGREAKVGLYWIDANGGEPHYAGDPGDAPIFSPDGKRIYFATKSYIDHAVIAALESVNLDGFDRRVHAKTLDADTSEPRISPDLKWIAFRHRQQYYVTRYRQTGVPVTLAPGDGANPVTQVSDIGGYALTWAGDSKRLHWAVGDQFVTAAIDENAPANAKPQLQRLAAGLEAPVDSPAGEIAFTNARLITMAGDQVIERGTVVVRGNRIVAVGAADQVTVPSGAKVIDATGKTVMPGLFDMHGHINNCYYTSSGLMPQRQSARYADLAFGVTTNYDPYSLELPAYTQTEMTLTGDMVGPRSIESGLIAFGRIAKVDGGYVPIFSYQDAQDFMARKKALGGTIVKSYRQPMRSQRQMLIKAGREAGVMVDVEGESNFYLDLTAVIDGNTNQQHNLPVATYYDDVVQLFKHGQTPHTPTLIVLNGELLGDNFIYQKQRVWEDPKVRQFVQVVTSGYSPVPTPHYAPPYVRGMTTINVADELWDVGFRSVSRSVKKLDDAGVIVNAGSHGHVIGLSLHWEMWLLSQGGMSNMNVLRTATLNGARTHGLDKQMGSLEPGKLADIIVLDRNPLEDIQNSNSVRYTMVNGRLYDANTMNEIGNYNKPRGKFFWEAHRAPNNIDWEKSWAEQ
ncbi:amidohydrolase family protein [Peristeroidobacter soli]|uniref:amidohydrolase family protein n=1 Tax=Peristeroidobacter soli TaxID=2497877 RepID=UPI00158E1CDC|nr:amidohydrolase family protein [Peristeroidobacter soli]